MQPSNFGYCKCHQIGESCCKAQTQGTNPLPNSNELQDTFKAQILIKINMAIMPKHLAFFFGTYSLLFSITHLISKPGMPVESEAEYLFMTLIEQDTKTKTQMVNITIDKNAQKAELDKENEQSNEEVRNM